MSFHLDLKENLVSLQQSNFIGRLFINKTLSSYFQLYFYQGQIIWAIDEDTINRSFQAKLETFCSHVDLCKISLVNSSQVDNWHYNTIGFLYQKRIISKTQIQSVIESQVEDILFDILQLEEREQLHYNIEPMSIASLSESGIRLSPIRCDAIVAFDLAQSQLKAWNSRALAGCSPNLAPAIRDLNFIKADLKNNLDYKAVAATIEQIDGQNSLREIAAKIRLPLLLVFDYIKPYIQQGAIDLIEVLDRSNASNFNVCLGLNIEQNLAINPAKISEKKNKLIMAIDDSNQMNLLLKEIVDRNNFSFVGVDNPLQVIPLAIERQADLFLLDANMPILNGYELYQQIQCFVDIKDKPIVFISAYEQFLHEIQIKLFDKQRVYYLKKPIDPMTLSIAIQKLLDGKFSELPSMLNELTPFLGI